MARTNIVLDDRLVAEAGRLTGIRTKRDLIHRALEELVRREARRQILQLEGKVRWVGNLARMRRGRGDSR